MIFGMLEFAAINSVLFESRKSLTLKLEQEITHDKKRRACLAMVFAKSDDIKKIGMQRKGTQGVIQVIFQNDIILKMEDFITRIVSLTPWLFSLPSLRLRVDSFIQNEHLVDSVLSALDPPLLDHFLPQVQSTPRDSEAQGMLASFATLHSLRESALG